MAKGRADYLKHIKGVKLTRANAIYGKCWECAYEGIGGRDCGIPDCPLYPFSYYRGVDKEETDE